MILSHALSSWFSRAVQHKGDLYQRYGNVRITDQNEREVNAKVQGTRLYQVHIECDGPDGPVSMTCTCPYYLDQGPCKHIWGALMAAERVQPIQIDDEVGQYIGVKVGGSGVLDKKPMEEEELEPQIPPPPPVQRLIRPIQPAPSAWISAIRKVQAETTSSFNLDYVDGELCYLVHPLVKQGESGLSLEVAHRRAKKTGGWTRLKTVYFSPSNIPRFPDPLDRRILETLGGRDEYNSPTYYSSFNSFDAGYRLKGELLHMLLPMMAATGRFMLQSDFARYPNDLVPLLVDDGPPFHFILRVHQNTRRKCWIVQGLLTRPDTELPIERTRLILRDGWILMNNRFLRLDSAECFSWMTLLKRNRQLSIPFTEWNAWMKECMDCWILPPMQLPEELQYVEVRPVPEPTLHIRSLKGPRPSRYLAASLLLRYGDHVIARRMNSRRIYDGAKRLLTHRDEQVERGFTDTLHKLGLRPLRDNVNYEDDPMCGFDLPVKSLSNVVFSLVKAGWKVEADGKLYKSPGPFQFLVTSGVDWLDVTGLVAFGDNQVSLPAILAELKRGQGLIQLGDGTVGILPEEWLKRYGMLACLGKAHEDAIRFSKSQAALLDVLLAAEPGVSVDAVFDAARKELREFQTIRPAEAPGGFHGTLREYQKEGLGWIGFLQRFGFGGCLADDMGLGKTIQALALLEMRRGLRAAAARNDPSSPGPSLVVMPRSLVFNWIEEARRFAPKLRILDHTGMGRSKAHEHFGQYDLVITTYGTLRRDIAMLKTFTFDYIILDEAQAIKNEVTACAKATRLLKAHHRLAMSGTPIENHLGELWSLFEFLNPGMLGASSTLGMLASIGADAGDDSRKLLARSLRPFILRRTKQQVAKDLPEKIEETIYCNLEAGQRKLYDELRDHYRESLLSKVDADGLGKSTIMVLEALLRLRQAACHPGLLDKSRTGESSAKLDILMGQIEDVLAEEHKMLVFSQFTSMLAIVRSRLDQEGIAYEYLDGKTQNRGECVNHFQTSPDCKLFLISLKAGGLGLNLTAAEYVVLLDPWWNPAVEAQAIDRTHRIGQTRRVFAYRLVARDTVEEKILELQKTKRQLADSIINADNSLIRNLTREDLEILLA